ncbi:MmcQ/YjbR family DNA-binding protein [Testudinibacter sp. P80/BLE/0925]|uniref:MmcQ/YjbR family DNA-binding protein n=1 Tax=Testudinibacter sp. TW-1 TaxID=3417757 RepID=UPI003D35B109
MTAEQLIHYINTQYSAAPDYPWVKYPDYAVFRHADRKWFCLLMKVEANKLGLHSEERLEVINLKAQPELVGALRAINGIFPAYHMNKEHWISVVLNRVAEQTIYELIDDSYRLTR